MLTSIFNLWKLNLNYTLKYIGNIEFILYFSQEPTEPTEPDDSEHRLQNEIELVEIIEDVSDGDKGKTRLAVIRDKPWITWKIKSY